nr:MAG TPA: hypothetical protein [Caudoviricetes sp.]
MHRIQHHHHPRERSGGYGHQNRAANQRPQR